jgi:hypothetical protein
VIYRGRLAVKIVRLTVAAGFAYKSFWLGWLRVAIESSFSVVLRHRSFAPSVFAFSIVSRRFVCRLFTGEIPC